LKQTNVGGIPTVSLVLDVVKKVGSWLYIV